MITEHSAWIRGGENSSTQGPVTPRRLESLGRGRLQLHWELQARACRMEEVQGGRSGIPPVEAECEKMGRSEKIDQDRAGSSGERRARA